MSQVSTIARTGMQAAEARAERSARNVANVNTDGYLASRVTTQEARDGGVTYRSVPNDTPKLTYNRDGRQAAMSNTDLAQETVERIGAASAFKANLAVLKTDDDMKRTLLSLKA